jgi:hypothetical protein
MTAITDAERRTYDAIWQHDAYAAHAPGEHYVDVFLAMSGAEPGQRITDVGCGSGKGGVALAARGFDVQLCDLTHAGLVPAARALPFTETVLWRGPIPWADWYYCCDVLEHLPLPFTMLVVSRLIARGLGAFFSIALIPDTFGALVGTPLHQSIQSFTAWRDQLAEIGEVVECRDLGDTGLYVVRSDR